MTDIILTTQNARYSHTAFGLRYLRANLGALRESSLILEYDLRCSPKEMADEILSHNPKIIGISIYIWNVSLALKLIQQLKKQGDVCIIVGGPEVSYNPEKSEFSEHSDFILCGEGENAFRVLCEQVLAGTPPQEQIIRMDPPNLNALSLPYAEYSDEDVSRRQIYVESTRGCPFECEYCISSLDRRVRRFPLDTLLREFRFLIERGGSEFKFVDRAMNVDLAHSMEILDFFLRAQLPTLRLHFEMMPDRFPPALRELISRFPPGALHLEIGVQTYNQEVADRIKRKTNYAVIDDHLRFLREETGALIHADLIAGLPGETLESFADGFDRLVGLRPHALQLGILKKLHGAPIARHDDAWQMEYNSRPPYEIISNSVIDADEMSRIKRFARYWDLLYNRGQFERSVSLIWEGEVSPFSAFMRWSNWLIETDGRTYAIPLDQLAERLFEYLINDRRKDPKRVASLIWKDYHKNGARRYPPKMLRPHLTQTS